ncbi:MAG: Fe-S cluster assembly protein SufD [Rhodocyclales bacterium]|nr:Fe-S cluster assembly protein SufD [Rhodocyclales bacterium]
MSQVEIWQDQYRVRAQGLPGATLPWLVTLRERAMERFVAMGWPTRRKEDWHHTSLAFLEGQTFKVPMRGAAPPEESLMGRLREGGAGHWLVFVNGWFNAALSQIGSLPEGATVDTMPQALIGHAERVEAHYGSAEDGGSPAALNAALATDGAYVHLARGVAVEAPIHLVFIATIAEGASHVRNLVIAEDGAEATLVEHYLGTSATATLTNAVTRIHAGADSRITHLKLQQEAEQALHLASIDTQQGRGSVFNSHSLSFGARLARNDITTRFAGEHCETLFNGMYHVDGKRHVDHHTVIDHALPHGVSREYYRGILDGSARGVFSGRIKVAPGAVKSDAMQRADSLLLSRQAEADARPELEIYAADVKCAHGATVGQIDDDSLFYLRARGMDEAHARNLLTYAFAAEALARIGVAPLRNRARAALLARLPGGHLLEELTS